MYNNSSRITDIISAMQLLQRGVEHGDDRMIGRAMRQAFSHRRKELAEQGDAKGGSRWRGILHWLVDRIANSSNQFTPERKNMLLKWIERLPGEDTHQRLNDSPNGLLQTFFTSSLSSSISQTQTTKHSQPSMVFVETEILLQLLLSVALIDNKCIDAAVECTQDLISLLSSHNRRTLFLIASQCYFYFARAWELSGAVMGTIRPVLLAALRTSSLRHDHHGQAMMMNLLLRNYLSENLYDAAHKLIIKSPHMEFRNNAQMARYNYYKGRIQAVMLDYGESYNCLMTALRKAPTQQARGFRLEVTKLAIIVQLLMGEIPERSIFAQKGLKLALHPYFELTRQVRVGELQEFLKVVEQFKDIFHKDRNYSLIMRLRQNVIRTGLKKISISYSRIGFDDICAKLKLEATREDIECIVAKAIRDGIIEAVIDHEGGFVKSRETIDVYSTPEPTEQFHRRLAYSFQLHNEAVRAMRFPPELSKAAKQDLKDADEQRKREAELVEELQEDGMDDEDDDIGMDEDFF